MKDAKIPLQTCPDCGHRVNRSTCMFTENASPKPDDVSVCINCGAVMRYDGELRLKLADLADILSLPKETQHQLERVQWAIKEAKKQGNTGLSYDYSIERKAK